MKAVAVIKEQKIDFILAVGGGSVIDGEIHFSSRYLKEINGNSSKRLLIKDLSKVIPFGTILTLPATSVNSGAVVTIEATQRKIGFGGSALFPNSICDPTVVNLYQKTIAKWCRRCLHSCLEQYLTYPHEGFLQDRMKNSTNFNPSRS
jgi:NADP-dependent alcohol dehydrogenase